MGALPETRGEGRAVPLGPDRRRQGRATRREGHRELAEALLGRYPRALAPAIIARDASRAAHAQTTRGGLPLARGRDRPHRRTERRRLRVCGNPAGGLAGGAQELRRACRIDARVRAVRDLLLPPDASLA